MTVNHSRFPSKVASRSLAWGLTVLFMLTGCAGPGEPGADRSAMVEAPPEPEDPNAPEEAPDFTSTINQVEVTLYFLRGDGRGLAAERREVFKTSTVNDQARQAVQALVDGPESNLISPLPPGTSLREIFVTSDGTAYVDFGQELALGISSGSSDAVFAVYAIVNTLADNFAEIRRVKILIEGDEAGDLGGHLDLSRPILPEMSLVAGRR